MRQLLGLLVWAPLALGQAVPGRYIVELVGEPAATAVTRGSKTTMATRRAVVQFEQARVRQAVETMRAEVVGSADTVANALIVQIPDQDAPKLASLPGVAHVYQAEYYQVMLDHAVPLHRAPNLWPSLGGFENAGAGIKIGIIDSGIDISHPAFQDPALSAPQGFPLTDRFVPVSFTNSKVIVARNYTPELDPSDNHGHGTAVAMCAGGYKATGASATITGMAPKAWLGNYKVAWAATPGATAGSTTDRIIMALDQAVADGMDVVNLSIGSVPAARPATDPAVRAVNRAVAAGVLVAVAAANAGPSRYTISSPGSAASAITAGANKNDRFLSYAVTLEGGTLYQGRPSISANSASDVTAPLVDVALLDSTGLGCNPLPANSLKNRIAVMLRGDCLFTVKQDNALAAGAAAIVMYMNASDPTLDNLGTWGANAPPSIMISNADGLDLKARLAANPGLTATIGFATQASIPSPYKAVASFSSRGPSVDMGIKPDVLAVGQSVYTAAPGSTYTSMSGTSFSSPLTAGAAALLRQARPGLTMDQYRSLLINSAAPFASEGDDLSPVQLSGAGLLDVNAAAQNTVAAYPTSLSFGAGGSTVNLTRTLTVTNVGPSADTFRLWMRPIGGPKVPAGSFFLERGASRDISLALSAENLAAGEYNGFIIAQGTQSAVAARVPYWYAVTGAPASIVLMRQSKSSGTAGAIIADAFEFVVLDASGVPVMNPAPAITASPAGASAVVRSLDAGYPGVFAADVVLANTSAANMFNVMIGDLRLTVGIVGL